MAELVNTRIPDLPALDVMIGGALIPIYDPTDDTTKYFDISTLLSSTSIDFRWISTFEYETGFFASYDGIIWESLVDDNIGNIPTEGAFWTERAKSASGFVQYESGLFTDDQVTVLNTLDGFIQIFRLIDATKPFDSTDFYLELCEGKWELASERTYLPVAQLLHGLTEELAVTFKDIGSGFEFYPFTTGDVVIGYVCDVVDDDNFIIRLNGTLVKGLSGLTEGSKYYVQSDGTIDTVATTDRAYIALSATTAIMQETVLDVLVDFYLPLAVTDNKTVTVGADKTLLFYSETPTGKISISLINDSASNNSYIDVRCALLDDSEDIVFQIGENDGTLDFNFTDSRAVKRGLLALGFGETTPTSGDGSYPDIPASGLMPVQMARNEFLSKTTVDQETYITATIESYIDYYWELIEDNNGATAWYQAYVDETSAFWTQQAGLEGVGEAQMDLSADPTTGATLGYREEGGNIHMMRAYGLGILQRGKLHINTDGGNIDNVGITTLVAGTQTVLTNKVKTGDIVKVYLIALSGLPLAVQIWVEQSSIVDGVSFVITSADVSDTSTVFWEIVTVI